MFGFLLLFVTIAALMFGFAWAMRAFGLNDSLAGGSAQPQLSPRELERLHDAISALDRRLERLEDQQRFLEGLLEERPDRSLPRPDSERSDSILFDTERESP